MSDPVGSSKSYFVGVGGEQTGPFTEAQVLENIHNGTIPQDALIWYEGLDEWQPIISIDYFSGAFEMAAQNELTEQAILLAPRPERQSVGSNASPFKPLAPSEAPRPRLSPGKSLSKQVPTFADPGQPIQAVFDRTSVAGSPFSARNLTLWGAVFCLGIAITSGVMLKNEWAALFTPENSARVVATNPPPRNPVPEPVSSREALLQKALAKFPASPELGAGLLQQLIRQNPTDSVGTRGLQRLLQYYKEKQETRLAGQFLNEIGFHEQAAEYFLLQPPSYDLAEKSIFMAFQKSRRLDRHKILIEDIQMLLGPLNNSPLAMDRIRMLERDFPGAAHPFSYYLKTPDRKIAEVFPRVSGRIVDSLISILRTDFPHLTLIGRPVVEIKKDATGLLRIVGSYRGTVQLNQDKLPNIHFVYWLHNATWRLVETNITVQRSTAAHTEQRKYAREGFTAAQLLNYLEGELKAQYPKLAPHQALSSRSF